MITVASKEEIDLLDIARHYVELAQQGSEWYAICPLPAHHDTQPSCAFNVEKQMWYCHGCQEGGDVFDLLQGIHGVDFRGAIEVLRDEHGINLRGSRPGSKKSDQTYEAIIWAQSNFKAELAGRLCLYDRNRREFEHARKYLTDRGFDIGDINRWNLGFSPSYPTALVEAAQEADISLVSLEEAGLVRKTSAGGYTDVFSGRIMIPIYDNSGRIIGYSGRKVYDGSKGKYINTSDKPLFKKSKVLMNWPAASKAGRKKDRLVIVEGPLDLLRAVKTGLTETVCTMGTALSDDQAKMIAGGRFKRIIFFGDGDNAGERGSLKRGRKLFLLNQAVYVVQTPKGEDPDSLGRNKPDQCIECVDQAISYLRFVYYFAEPKDEMEQADVADHFQELLAQVKDPVRRSILAKEVSDILKIEFKAPEHKILPKKLITKTEEVSLELSRIELDIIFALIKHFDEPAVVEMLLSVGRYQPTDVFSPLCSKVFSCILPAVEVFNGDYELAKKRGSFPDEVVLICDRALALNTETKPDWNRFLIEVTRWITVNLAKRKLDEMKEELVSGSSMVELWTEYLETSRKRLKTNPNPVKE